MKRLFDSYVLYPIQRVDNGVASGWDKLLTWFVLVPGFFITLCVGASLLGQWMRH